MTLDKYARDFKIWRDWASINYHAAKHLFDSGDPFLMFPASVLGHHALEMYLKSALIANGMTVFDPKKAKLLTPEVDPADCVWGHNLSSLAMILARRSPTFDISRQMNIVGSVTLSNPMTVEEGLRIFDPFFSELRYPQEVREFGGLGEDHRHLLEALVNELRRARFKWPVSADSFRTTDARP